MTNDTKDEAEEWADFIRGITELAYQTGWNDHSKYIDYTIQTGTVIPTEIVKSSGLIQLHNKIADLLNNAKEEEGQEQKTGSDAATDDPESPTD